MKILSTILIGTLSSCHLGSSSLEPTDQVVANDSRPINPGTSGPEPLAPYTPVVVLACEISGIDNLGAPAPLTLAAYDLEHPERHLGLCISQLQEEVFRTLLTADSSPFPQELQTPDEARYVALAKEYFTAFIEKHKLPSADWELSEANVIKGHAWGPEGWRPTNPADAYGLEVHWKKKAFRRTALVDPKSTLDPKKMPGVAFHFYVNVQRQ